VTLGDTVSGGSDVSVAVYEQLRLHLYAGGAAPGGPCGLIVLLRQGLAGWLAWRMTGAAASAPATAPQRAVRAPLAADDQHASLVHVLASLARSAGKERNR